MDRFRALEIINELFVSADERNWERIVEIFDSSVLLDYSSMNGGEPVNLSGLQIIELWKRFLPGFDCTHHQISNFLFKLNNGILEASCYCTATHYLKNESGNNVWTVVCSYNFELKEVDNSLRISKMKLNLKYMDGNMSLVEMATKRAAEKK